MIYLSRCRPIFARLNVEGIHCFTFNQVAATEEWRQANLT